ncbi:uncharacterized protein LOC143460075 [Clavelina lepadiformis]|uniref:Uncharacterized protein n=1 Tax=Clavelina lepadiformis TaxID=159417 RepID=A0ABP0F7Z0_CLALP
MMSERFLIMLNLMFNFVTIWLFSAFALGKKLNIPGSDFFVNGPLPIIEKYPADNIPAKPLVVIGWTSCLLSGLGSAILLLKVAFVSSDHKSFRPAFYLCWIGANCGCAIWSFTFDREKLIHSLVTVLCVCLLAIGTTALACGEHSNSGKQNSWYNKVILSYLGLFNSWAFTALTSTTSLALYYKPSAEQESAELIGLLTIEKCATIGNLTMAAAFFAWVVLDLTLASHLTNEIKTIYPAVAVFMFGLFLSNFSTAGISVSQAVCLMVATISIVVWSLRSFLKKYLGLLENKSKKNN